MDVLKDMYLHNTVACLSQGHEDLSKLLHKYKEVFSEGLGKLAEISAKLQDRADARSKYFKQKTRTACSERQN